MSGSLQLPMGIDAVIKHVRCKSHKWRKSARIDSSKTKNGRPKIGLANC